MQGSLGLGHALLLNLVNEQVVLVLESVVYARLVLINHSSEQTLLHGLVVAL